MGKYDVNEKRKMYVGISSTILVVCGIAMLITAGRNLWVYAITAYGIYLLFRGLYSKPVTAAVFFEDGVSIKTKELTKIFYFDQIVRINFKELEEETDHLSIVTKYHNHKTGKDSTINFKILYEGRNLYQEIHRQMQLRKNVKS
jgi:uncharacterized membrane protein